MDHRGRNEEFIKYFWQFGVEELVHEHLNIMIIHFFEIKNFVDFEKWFCVCSFASPSNYSNSPFLEKKQGF